MAEENSNINLAGESHWNGRYEGYNLAAAGDDDATRQLLLKYIPKGKGSCFEIGCFPGYWLSVLGELGYTLSGLDMAERTPELTPWLKSLGYPVGKIAQLDFDYHKPRPAYDIVCSFGFVEHYMNYKEVISHQAKMVKPGGYVIVTVPNMSGIIQKTIHKYLDNRSFRNHNLKAMSPLALKNSLSPSEFTVVFCGYYGKFHCWFEDQPRPFWQTAIIFLLLLVRPLWKFLPAGNPSYAPFIGLIAKKYD